MSGTVTMPLAEYEALKKKETGEIKRLNQQINIYKDFYEKFKHEKLKRLIISATVNSITDHNRLRILSEDEKIMDEIHDIMTSWVVSNDKELRDLVAKELFEIKSEIYRKIRESDKWYRKLF